MIDYDKIPISKLIELLEFVRNKYGEVGVEVDYNFNLCFFRKGGKEGWILINDYYDYEKKEVIYD